MSNRIKIAIIGGTGLLGSNLIKLYKNRFNIKAFSRSGNINISVNYNYIIDSNNLKSELNKKFKKWQPDIIINTIALVDLKKCEDDYNNAYNINCNISKILSLIAKELKSYYIHISTDHFFMDNKIKHTENDTIVLLNNYAKSKFEAEKEVLNNYKNSLVVRTNIIGFRNTKKSSFFEWLLKSLVNRETISLYQNYYTSPIAVNQLGDILIKCFEKKLKGIYNISNKEVINKYDFGIKTAEIFELTNENINKTYIELDMDIKRALTLGLDVSKIEKDLMINMPTIEETLKVLRNEYMEMMDE